MNRYYTQLRKTVPVSSLIKNPRFQTTGVVDPHAPVLRVNKEEINSDHAYFKPLATIIYTVWEHKWTCMECAIYRKEKEFIVRVVKIRGSKRKTTVVKAKKQWETSQQRIPKELLNCVPKGKNRVECVDPQFGIFKI